MIQQQQNEVLQRLCIIRDDYIFSLGRISVPMLMYVLVFLFHFLTAYISGTL